MLEFSVAMLLVASFPAGVTASTDGGGLQFSFYFLGVIRADDAQVNRDGNQRIADENRDARRLGRTIESRGHQT